MSKSTVLVNAKHVGLYDYDVYIGRMRSQEHHFGNPFTSRDLGSKKAAVISFERWLRGDAYRDVEPGRRLWILANLEQLRGKIIACNCTPEICHGDVYIKLLAEVKCDRCNNYIDNCVCYQEEEKIMKELQIQKIQVLSTINQIEGRIDGHRFYFKMRGGISLDVAPIGDLDPLEYYLWEVNDSHCPLINKLEGTSLRHPGYASRDEAIKHLESCCELFLGWKRTQSEDELSVAKENRH